MVTKTNWKKFGFDCAKGVVKALEDNVVENTDNQWDNIALNAVKTTLALLESKFVVDEE